MFHPVAFEGMDGAKIGTIGLIALLHYNQKLIRQVQVLTSIIEETGPNPVVVNDLMYWFAFDSMGDFGFGVDFGMMKSRKWIDAALNMRSAIGLLGPFSPAIWIPRVAFRFTPGIWKVKQWFHMLEFADNCVNTRLREDHDSRNIASWFIKEYKSNGETEVGQRLLSGDIATSVVAGSTNITALSSLPHLNGVISESMRLLPAILTFSSRVTPLEGLKVDGTYIPGNTKICAPRYSIGRCGKPELIKDKRAFAPFGVGRTACVGRHLATTQLRLVAATLLSGYNIRFASNEPEGQVFDKTMRDQLAANPGALCLIFERR
ncbi:cytochrome P450 [Lindgomyces ingoldianus]|uniref:Cytochrome P450 n=1 Tax=Lindgomyces ingoldianus TaxID=673940 RepID=A0ACB6QAJ5_9PLEO|nr:cytochrome P450 [Lindgomyces ingoldianus]KAF2463953.1 cytochrome P450 [Lindgomyces ingoldianus]